MFTPTLEKYRDRVLGSKGKTREAQRAAKADLLPNREKMSLGTHRRIFSHNRSQIRRWLGNQIGRPWDVVVAELCGMTPKNSLERIHLMQAAENTVEVNTVEENGVLYALGSCRRWEVRGGTLYVRNGIIARLPHCKTSKPTSTLLVTFTGQMEAVGVSNGQWFVIGFKEQLPDMPAHDVFLRKTVGQYDTLMAYGKAVVAISKRAMSKREIRTFKAGR